MNLVGEDKVMELIEIFTPKWNRQIDKRNINGELVISIRRRNIKEYLLNLNKVPIFGSIN
jgi:hypothetical protein